ncbi:hypothetical protein B0H16DRAFT_1458854 [Mycena metata]|uniref:CxC2-like cysteine cluster KDZ transposase-associated domain-containing protein n=1 Tax=Mycena metata TaxID=1033252 RepID=A0AAD7ND61_9AGAR|nr:hypothetical protein B0H16DRAFT_1458854 [Mycena metata]
MSRATKKRKWPDTSNVHTHTHSFSLDDMETDPITTIVNRSSADNRRVYHHELLIPPPSPDKRARLRPQAPSTSSAADTNHADDLDQLPGLYEMGLDDADAPPGPAPGSTLPKVVKPSDPVLHRFRSIRNMYCRNMLRRAGCGNAGAGTDTDLCRLCKREGATSSYRCKNCFGDAMLCAECIVDRHAENPLHRIEFWNGRFFETTSLKSLGLRVQLGHAPRQRCSEPRALHTDFIVLHTNGIHEVAVDACDCENAYLAGPPEEQMLRAGWFPATDDKARTCATFEVLDHFLISTHQAKTTVYDFYSMLEKLTHNAGIKPTSRYHAFLRMCREFAHLLSLIRAGCAHRPEGVEATGPGELCVLCPVCPHPGVNIPDDWENVSEADKFLYILFLALDACFRLKRRLVSSELKDPSLGAGWSYMVDTKPYRKYLLTVTDQKEMSTCSGLAALDYANTKFSRGYSATGVGMGVCARHEFIQPNGVGDLQKGERYANIDWIFACILKHKDPRLRKIISYDIVCQWWVNLKKRLQALPPLVRLVLAMQLIRFVIPKMHIHSHTLACQVEFSLNLVPGSAQTDGEGIERPWAHIGGVGTSTREMGPGSREDTLNSHWSFWNWQKLIGLGERLRTRLDRARSEYATQLEGFAQFSVQQADRVPAWKTMVEAFEADPNKPNPYKNTTPGITEADVLLSLENDEAKRVENGIPSISTVSPSSFVAAGLDLEDQQRRVRVQVELKKAGTTAQQIDIVGLRRKLTVSLKRFRQLQATYTPASIVALAARENVPVDETVENVPLFLPSALSAAQREHEPLRGLAVYEDQLRDAQCSTALVRLRNQLHMKSRLLTYKQIQSRNQGANTRSRTIVARNESKIRLHSEKYQMAWAAKVRLAGGNRAQVGWRLLAKEDIRCMEDPEELRRKELKRRAQEQRRDRREADLRREGELPPLTTEDIAIARGGENVREVSWIWTGTGSTGTDADIEEALRIEWAKAYARTQRWHEEVRLLEEEVRRFPISMEYRATQWEGRARAVRVGEIPENDAEGAIAYALKQATMYRDLAVRFEVSMTEERRGRGKRRRVIHYEDDDNERERRAEEDEVGQDDDEDELADLRGNADDEDFLLGGGEDDD